jgi:hypothetical protein
MKKAACGFARNRDDESRRDSVFLSLRERSCFVFLSLRERSWDIHV